MCRWCSNVIISHILIRGIWRGIEATKTAAICNVAIDSKPQMFPQMFCLMFYALVGFMANEEKPQTEIFLCVLLFPLNGVRWLLKYGHAFLSKFRKQLNSQ